MTPNFLYKYGVVDCNSWKLFSKSEIYFSFPRQFNDPFECKPNFQPVIIPTKEEAKRYIKNKAPLYHSGTRNSRRIDIKTLLKKSEHMDDPFWRRIIDRYEHDVQNVGIYCLSSIPDSILLWSHYAGGHKGFCIEFHISSSVSVFTSALEVIYDVEYPQIDICDPVRIENFTYNSWTRRIYLSKFKGWEYEKEWRIIEYPRPVGNGGGVIRNFHGESLSRVIFGCAMSDLHKKQIQDWLRAADSNASLWRAETKRDKYGIDIVPE